jgi:hypothetical protein
VSGTKELASGRVWVPLVLVWAVIVILFFVLGSSGAGFGALIGGPAGALGSYLAIRFLRRRGVGNRQKD